MFQILITISLLFGQLPNTDKKTIGKETAKAIKNLQKEKCINWIKKIGADSQEIEKILLSTSYYDAKRTKIPLKYSGILNGRLRSKQSVGMWAVTNKVDLVQASYGNRMVVYVNNYKTLRYEHLIHESFHFYFQDYDITLAKRLGVRLQGRFTDEISREIARHCK